MTDTIPVRDPAASAAMDAVRQEALDAVLDPVAQAWVMEQIRLHIQELAEVITTQPVYLDTLSVNLFHHLATTTMDRIRGSNDRMPVFQVIKGYVPGCIHVTVEEDGNPVVRFQDNSATSADEAWVRSPDFDTDQTLRMGMVALLAASGVGPGDEAYLLDDVTVQQRTKAMQKRMAELVAE